MSLDPWQFRRLIVIPVLGRMGMHSPAAENLLVGTAIQESGLRHLMQLPNGPALGVFQMEPATHDDIWKNYLTFRPDLRYMVSHFAPNGRYAWPGAEEMIGNMYYAAAMCRMHYFRAPEALPDADDIPALAEYWKRHYNTPLGKGKAEDFVGGYNRMMGGA